jgi:hypothetical protein
MPATFTFANPDRWLKARPIREALQPALKRRRFLSRDVIRHPLTAESCSRGVALKEEIIRFDMSDAKGWCDRAEEVNMPSR